MTIVVDASALLSILMNEPERESIIAASRGHVCIAPVSLIWEIGNALSAMFRKSRISDKDVDLILKHSSQCLYSRLKSILQRRCRSPANFVYMPMTHICCNVRPGLTALCLHLTGNWRK